MKALSVLIIEDETFIALLFADVLAELGHAVCASEYTEAGAIAAAARCEPDLIIADAHLIEGSGISAVDIISQSGFVPHIFTSGGTLDKRQFNPAAGILQKPFNEQQLIAAIKHALDPANILIGQQHMALRCQP